MKVQLSKGWEETFTRESIMQEVTRRAACVRHSAWREDREAQAGCRTESGSQEAKMLPPALPSPARPQGPAVAVVKPGQVWAGLSFRKSPGRHIQGSWGSWGERWRRGSEDRKFPSREPARTRPPSPAEPALCTGPRRHRCPAPGPVLSLSPPAAPGWNAPGSGHWGFHFAPSTCTQGHRGHVSVPGLRGQDPSSLQPALTDCQAFCTHTSCEAGQPAPLHPLGSQGWEK